MVRAVKIREVGPRDGLQNEPIVVGTDEIQQMVIARALGA